jgi:signal transduction histidine kinase
VRVHIYRLAALLAALLTAPDVLLLGAPFGPDFAVRLSVAGVLLALAEVAQRGAFSARVEGVAVGLVACAGMLGVLVLTGARASPYYPTLFSVPLLMVLFIREDPVPVLVTVAGAFGADMVLGSLQQVPAGVATTLAAAHVSMAILAFTGQRLVRRLEAAALEERARRLDTERQALDLRRQVELERLALVGQLAAGVAHEVNNPLAFIAGNLSYVRDELARPPDSGPPEDVGELVQALEESLEGTRRIERIVRDLQVFTRPLPVERAWAPVSAAVADAVRLASIRLHGVATVQVDVDPEVGAARMEDRRLVQVLLNLLVNAADALETAPHPDRPAEVRVRARRVGGHVEVEVEDNGPGIPPHVLPRIFEPFFTTKPAGKGTGLGLAISRQLVAAEGGTLTGESLPRGGARFTVRVPRAPEAQDGVTGETATSP